MSQSKIDKIKKIVEEALSEYGVISERIIEHGYDGVESGPVEFEKWASCYGIEFSEGIQYLAHHDPERFANAVCIEFSRRGNYRWYYYK